ncbi:MAG: aminotransferase class V-fold PLP-dependent enzyme [Lachnospiraceae bacterium]|nr:aminotransferase class V-fold PLP-dependent enzyme [Lachnospiraceae bacterium]
MTVKYSFKNDYSELAHPQVLAALAQIGNKQFDGYGLDGYTCAAKEVIKAKIKRPDAQIHFLTGGTQANLVCISSILRPYESVIACESAHIATHETGAIEATGHKICTVKGRDGKLNPEDIEGVLNLHRDEHMVKPKLVFISQATETGTIYSKDELEAISACCKKYNLYLHLDGARLGMGLNSDHCDMTYADVAELVDTFYIGGTKNGALFGEAVVICNAGLQEWFRYHVKQKGAMLAKGTAVSLQFMALFAGDTPLYDTLALHANDMAQKLAYGMRKLDFDFYSEPQSNQIFPVLPYLVWEKMKERYDFYEWLPVKEKGKPVVVRLVTSWATPEEIVEMFLQDLLQ